MSTRTRTTALLISLGVASAIALAGCASGGSGGDTSPSPTESETTATTPSSTPSASASEPTSTSTPVGGDDGGSALTDRCTTDNLSGTTTAGGGGAAGSVEIGITLKNTGTSACRLQGWPGVSFVGDSNGTQIGAAAQFDRTSPHATVTLQPGGTATAALKITNAQNYPAADCSAVSADGFRVYPPGSKTSLFIADSGLTACKSASVDLLTVKALVAG